MMKSTVIAFVVALALTSAAVPFVRRIAFRLGAVSNPGGRHIHTRSIPRLGGVAVAIGLIGSMSLLLALPDSRAELMSMSQLLIGLFVGGVWMCGVGAIDDVRGVRALYKLAAQLVAAVGAWGFGFRIENVHLPIFGDVSMGIFGLPITVLWIVGIINAINLIDGLDGLAGGVVFFAGMTNLAVAVITNNPQAALPMAAMLGAVLGFLFFNFNPARIFLGDSGSYFLGFFLATMSLVGTAQKASTTVSILVPLIALGVPILDTLLSIVRRFLERRPIFSPDRGHLHHRLLDMGITHRRAVLILYGVSIVLTVGAIGVSLGRSWQAGLAILGTAIVMLGLVRFVGYFEYVNLTRQQRSRMLGADVERLRRILPTLAARLSAARDEAAALALFEQLALEASIAAFEIAPNEGDAIEHLWLRPGTETQRSDLPVISLPLGHDRASHVVRARVESDRGDVSPQAEVLFQVMVDMLAHALLRHRSRLVPTPVAPTEAASPAPSSHGHSLQAL